MGTSQTSVYVAPVTSGMKPPFAWKRVIDPSHDVVSIAAHRNFCMFSRTRAHPTTSWCGLRCPRPDMRQAVTVLPER